MSKHVCFILDWYPTKTNNGCVFVKHLICAIADKGVKCTVIAPIIGNIKNEEVPYKRVEHTEKGSEIVIYTPKYTHLGSKKHFIKLSMHNHFSSVMKVIKKHNLHFDAVYGHFIYQCGLTAARVGEKLGIPSYCACGENSLRFEKENEPYTTGFKYADWKNILQKSSGIVSVSSNNKDLLLKNDYIPSDMKIGVFPNAVDDKKFYVSDKTEARKKLGLPENEFIIVFTGAFTERKGIIKLNNALKKCDGVFSIFLGDGENKPDCDNILFCGKVQNDQVALYLNSADVFVLPTIGEGCCNAIVEALSCGVPVISSDLPFNDDILDEKTSLRIDVTDEDEIMKTIMLMKNDKEILSKLRQGALDCSNKFDISTRADNILRFMGLV